MLSPSRAKPRADARRSPAAVGLFFTGLALLALLVPAAGCRPVARPPQVAAADAPAAASGDDTPAAGDHSTAETPAADSPEDPSAVAGESPDVEETAAPGEAAVDDHPFRVRVPAPPLDGGVAWINTAGPLDLQDLRGKFVLLDFWTYCCINCMHVLPELKKLEHAYPDELVVIGVHSAKFDAEKDSDNIREAVLRYEIEHPVINDARHAVWNKFGINSWPTMLLIDPEGNVVWGRSGESKFAEIDTILRHAIPYYRKQGTLDTTPLRFDLEAHRARQTPLRFPGKLLADPEGKRLFIADSNHNRIAIADLDGKLQTVIGSGAAGRDDGDYATASFDHPQGMCLVGQTLYVADTENHMLRAVDLKAKQVRTIAGTGEQSRGGWPGLENLAQSPLGGPLEFPERWVGKPAETPLNSPWALWAHDDQLYIAMAGPHQIWKMPLDASEIGPYAGNGREDIVDGPLLPRQPYAEGYSSFAQPSGFASDGKRLYVADSEGSSIRSVPFDPEEEVTTVVGTAHLFRGRLFEFGDVDGQGEEVRLQHALGVVFHDGLLYVADTYNNKIKVIDVEKRTARTLVGSGEPGSSDDPPQFDEPAGITAAGDRLYVADTNNHAIRVIDLASDNRVTTLEIAGLTPPAPPEPEGAPPRLAAGAEANDVAATELRPADNRVTLAVRLRLPAGWKINPLAPLRYQVEFDEEAGPVDRAVAGQIERIEKRADTFEVPLPLRTESGSDRLRLAVEFYYCREGAEGICKMGTAAWNVPLTLSADAKSDRVDLETVVD